MFNGIFICYEKYTQLYGLKIKRVKLMSEDNVKMLNLLDVLLVISKKMKFIIINFVLIVIIAFTISMLMTKLYKAEVVFMPQNKGGSGLLSIIGGSMGADVIGGSFLSKRQYSALLNSRELREKLIGKFDLIKYYGNEKMPNPIDFTLKGLADNIIITEKEEGGLGITDVISTSIQVIDKDPKMAADMANYIYYLLEEKVMQLNNIEYSSVMEFMGRQIEECKNKLDTVRSLKKQFQLENHIYSIPEQLSMVIQSYAMSKSELLAIEKEISYLNSVHSYDYSKIKQLKVKRNSLNKILKDFEVSQKSDIFIGLTKSIDLQNQFVDLSRDVETYEQLLSILEQQMEQAHIKSVKDYSPFYLVDKARTPEYKFKPKKAIVIAVIVFLYMSVLISFIFIKEYYSYITSVDPSIKTKWKEISAFGKK